MDLHPPLPMNPWLWSQTMGETYAAGLDPVGMAGAQRDARLARLMSAAFAESPFYRSRRPHARVGDLPRLDEVEPVEKAELMQPLRRLGHRSAHHPRQRRCLPGRARAPGRRLPRAVPGVDQFGHHRRARHLRAGRAEPGGLRRARRAAPARHGRAVAAVGRPGQASRVMPSSPPPAGTLPAWPASSGCGASPPLRRCHGWRRWCRPSRCSSRWPAWLRSCRTSRRRC